MDLVGEHLLQRKAGQHHLGHLVPGLVHAPAVDALQGEAFEDHLVPVDAGAARHDAEHRDLAAVVHAVKHVAERARVAAHLQAYVEAFDVQVLDGVFQRLLGNVDHPRGAHVGGEFEAVVVDVGDDHVARTDVLADAGGDDADRAGAGDQDILTDQVEFQRTMGSIAVRIEERGQLGRDLVRNRPQVRGRHRHVLGERAVAVYADADRVRTQMLAASAAVAAMAADDVAFGGNAVADLVASHAGADLDNAADELMADGEAGLDRALAPLVPLVDVQVGAADGCLLHLDQHFVRAHHRQRHLFHPDALFGLALDQGFHRLRHGKSIVWPAWRAGRRQL